jgi:hypothetical protein
MRYSALGICGAVADLQRDSCAGDIEVCVCHKLADGLDELLEQAALGETCFEHFVARLTGGTFVPWFFSGRDPACAFPAGFLCALKSQLFPLSWREEVLKEE